MITLEKLKEYERFRGYYDGFYMQKVRIGTDVTTSEEWHLIGSLIQDVKLVDNKLASKDFELRLNKALEENCNGSEVVDYLKELATRNW